MMNHPFHIVSPSPWPFLVALSTMSTLINAVIMFIKINTSTFMMNLLITLLCMYLWWMDIIKESYLQGTHTNKVMLGLKMGVILFIISEAFLFVSLFWMLLHSSLSPAIEISMSWPPPNIQTHNPMDIPLLNSMLLILSGMYITQAHYFILTGSNNFYNPMSTSIGLGIVFMMIQVYEFLESPFSMSDSIYGSAFFMLTGFHGLHVIIGLVFLYSAFMRLNKGHMSKTHHIHFEAAAWYWHFVDVVWILLFLLLYL